MDPFTNNPAYYAAVNMVAAMQAHAQAQGQPTPTGQPQTQYTPQGQTSGSGAGTAATTTFTSIAPNASAHPVSIATLVSNPPVPIPFPGPEDGVYWIRSVTKDRYLDVAYSKKEDGAEVIGQTLNEGPTNNQKWKIRRETGAPGPARYIITSVFDPERHLTVAKDGPKKDKVVMNKESAQWVVIPASDFNVYRIASLSHEGNKVLSVINSAKQEDWNAVVAPDEGIIFAGDAPKKHHQLWSFVKDPYVR